MSDARKATDSFRKSAINPRTGTVWKLTDAEVSGAVDALQAKLRDPKKALKFLKEQGFLTASGKLPRKYGG